MNRADDVFDTAALRERVLNAWRQSPARFREDANAEEDLRLDGYRDRLLVELAANASDAAPADGGSLLVSVVDDELRVANTGNPLDADGVAALASLRASAKRTGSAVGRFGVGFSAVLAVSEAPRIVSTSGGVRFSAQDTRQAVAEIPELADELARRQGEVPVLRLVWPAAEESPPEGYATEVRLRLRSELDVAALLAEAAEQAPDFLLTLPGLRRIRVGEREWRREQAGDVVVLDGPSGRTRWLVRRSTGVFPQTVLAGLGVEARQRPEFSVCWAVATDHDGIPVPLDEDVLHAPTPTDEQLSLPARLLATLPLEPGRRRVLPGPATDTVLATAAEQYPALLTGLRPEHRIRLLPAPGFPRSTVDAALREKLTASLCTSAWLPAVSGDTVPPTAASVLDVPSAALAELLVDVVPGLIDNEYSNPRYAPVLATLGVNRLRPADVIEALSGLERPPQWWSQVYRALAATDGVNAEELGGLPVPLTDGRIVLGPREVLLPSMELSELVGHGDGAQIAGLRIVHPDAVHSLLERLGARRAGADDVLDTAELRAAVERSVADAADGVDISGLVDLALRLVQVTAANTIERPWLASLALPDVDGNPRRADELLLPQAKLFEVIDPEIVGPDASLGALADRVADAWPATVLTAVGVLDTFTVVVDEAPTGPDHDLDDEQGWWSAIGGDANPPTRFIAVRNLDLVAEDAWPQALRLVSAEPEAWHALSEVDGYTAWWISRYASLAGQAPRHWRLPEADDLAGLYDAVPDAGLSTAVLAAAGVRQSLSVSNSGEAAELLARLGDPKRVVPQGVCLRTHAVLADAVAADRIDLSEVDEPGQVRCVDGVVVEADRAVVLDQPWLLPALAGAPVVALSSGSDPAALADLLNLPLAGDGPSAVPADDGVKLAWADLSAVVLACELIGVPTPAGAVAVHDELTVAAADRRVIAPWWVAADGTPHAEDSPDGLARALAWTVDRWPQRHLIAALLAEPTVDTLLS